MAPRRVGLVLVCGLLLGALALGLSACAASSSTPGGTPGVDIARAPVEPAPWDLSTPETAVRSYLDWVSFSYRMANSEIPTATMTPGEFVRVDAYIQLNRTEGKALEQTLESIETTLVSEDTTSAIVTARETWAYQYFSLETLGYLTDAARESYETTYALVREPLGWLVDRVEARVIPSD